MTLQNPRRHWSSIFLFIVVCSSSAWAQKETLALSGLQAAVEILKDRWGIAHIYAQNEPDLFFAQGYSAASNRLFQLEIWRRQATGTTAEILGRRELKRDTGARLHRFRGDLKKELNYYHPRGEAIINAFVSGINAYIAQTESNPSLLPIEFSLLGIKPGRWTPEVVISRHQGLMGNVTQELAYGRAVSLLGTEKVRELLWLRPGKPDLNLDPAIDGSLLAENILDLYRAFRESIQFKPDDVLPAARTDTRRIEAAAPSRMSEFAMLASGGDIGSNNWVVGGKRTLTGFPLLANDPHRVIQAPSLRYWVHLVAPGWNVIGGGEPALPGVSIGHNEHGAWGFTVFGQDTEDLYMYETNPSNALQYRYGNGWEDMKIIRESIPIKDEQPIAVDLKYTRHGPILYEDLQHHKAYALRAAWMDIGAAPYLASLRMNQSRTWEEFREACSYSRIPAENMIWADVNKNIGYQAVGVSPIRPTWSGLVPVPGDGRYEWEGYLPIKALPHVLNPEKGFYATANNFTVPDGYPYPEALHFTWGDEIRAVRIEEFLASGRMHTVADMMKLQHDELSIAARVLVPLLREVDVENALARKARDLLLSWDYVLAKDSVPAAIYVAWERRLQSNLRSILVPETARQSIGSLNLKRVIDWLLAPDGNFGPEPVRGRDALLVKSLSETIADLTKQLGSDMNHWQYGQPNYKHVQIRHPLSEVVNAKARSHLEIGLLPRGGYAATVNSTGAGNNQTSGASFRIIADTENWDNSIGTNTPGQSGDPASPHYRDLFELWAKGKYFPIFFTRNKVESVTEQRTTLAPLMR